MKKLAPMAVILALVLTGARTAAAEDSKDGRSPASYETADLKRGGLLYDNWYRLTGNRPEGTHPAYPPDGRKSGADTWRCKECHGWDYLGKDGRYRKGSHYTGIAGILAARTQAPERLFSTLSSESEIHDFSRDLSETDRWALVKFMREGVFDVSGVFAAAGGAIAGDPDGGGSLYERHCASCHGKDGNAIDFKPDKEGMQGVGWLARDNPQETLHKIRWGHPGSAMPSMVVDAGLSNAEAVDVLVYCRGLE